MVREWSQEGRVSGPEGSGGRVSGPEGPGDRVLEPEGLGGQEYLPPVRPDAPVRVWASCRVRGQDGRVYPLLERPDALGDSEIITNRLGRGVFLPRLLLCIRLTQL